MPLNIVNRFRKFFLDYPVGSAWCCGGIGLLIGLFGPWQATGRSSIPKLKEGIMVVFPTANLFDPISDLLLRGQKVQLIRRTADGAIPCKLTHTPLTFAANEKIGILSGPLAAMESFVMLAQESDLKKPDIAAIEDRSIPQCTYKVKIVYGDDQ